MKINPVTSELVGGVEVNGTRTLPPDIKVKQLTSIVKVRNGQKVLIGGLIGKEESIYHNKVPLIGDLPVIGNLFHSRQKKAKKSELFILIEPKIVDEEHIPTIDEVELWRKR